MREATAVRIQPGSTALLCALAWAIPGGAHLWLRQWSKGLVFIIVLPLMFAIGAALQGRLFPFDLGEPLTALAFLAELGIGLPYFIAQALNFGAGQVTAITFEYGNTFLIVSGLLNVLVVLDARDIALGRKPAPLIERPR
jgi:hypothetical protein